MQIKSRQSSHGVHLCLSLTSLRSPLADTHTYFSLSPHGLSQDQIHSIFKKALSHWRKRFKTSNIHFCSILVSCLIISDHCSTFEHSPQSFPLRDPRGMMSGILCECVSWMTGKLLLLPLPEYTGGILEIVRRRKRFPLFHKAVNKTLVTQFYTSRTTTYSSCDSVWVCITDWEVCYVVENNRGKVWASQKTGTDKGFGGMELTRQLSDNRL